MTFISIEKFSTVLNPAFISICPINLLADVKFRWNMPDIAEQFFNCSNRERAIFEAGIKLGTIYHQYVGAPVSLSNLESLEEAIKQSVLVQPFVADASVKINPENIHRHKGTYKYITLTGDMLDVSLDIQYKDSGVRARLRYIKEMDYPLMYLED